jgi:hypothetical protein
LVPLPDKSTPGLQSRNGTQCQFDSANRRNSNQKQPRPTTKDISSFEHKGNAYEGIEWGPRQVIEAFDFLTDISPDRTLVGSLAGFPVPSEDATISLTAEFYHSPAAESDIYGDVPPNSLAWHAFDIPAMETDLSTTPCPNQSWYARLKAVCDSTLIRLIVLNQGINNAEGGRQHWTDEFVSMNIQRVITVLLPDPAATSHKPAPLRFPIDDGSLDAWRTDFEKFQILGHAEPTEIESKMQSVSRGVMAKINPQTLKKAVEEAADIPYRTLNELSARHEEATGIPIPAHLSEEQFGSVFTYPYAPLGPYQLDDFTEAFIGTNVFGQATLMFSRIEAEYVRLQVLQAQISDDMTRLDSTATRLAQQIKMYEEAHANYDKASKDYSEKQSATQHLRDRFATLSGEQNSSSAAAASRPFFGLGLTRRSSSGPRLDSPGPFGS